MRPTIKKKLIGSYLVVFLTTSVLAGFGYSTLNRQTDTLHRITRVDTRLFEAAKAIETSLLQHRRYEKDYFLNIGRPEIQNQHLEQYMKKSVALKRLIEQFNAFVEGNEAAYLTNEIRNKVQSLFENYVLYYRGFLKVADQVRVDVVITPQKANTLMAPYETTIHELESNIAEIVSTITAGIDHTRANAERSGVGAKSVFLLFSGICVLLISILSLVVSTSILKLLRHAHSVSDNAEDMGTRSGTMSSIVTNGGQTTTNRGVVSSSVEAVNTPIK